MYAIDCLNSFSIRFSIPNKYKYTKCTDIDVPRGKHIVIGPFILLDICPSVLFLTGAELQKYKNINLVRLVDGSCSGEI